MSQNDFNIANQGFPATRADINSALQALASNSAGTAEPSTTYAYQFWYDETNELLKMRNSDNDAWITIGTFDQVADTFSIDKIAEGNSSVEVVDTGTGYVAITVDGVEAARVDANGRLGIGTTSPSVALHAYDASSDTVLYVDSGNANGSHMRFLASGSVKHFVGSGGGFALGDVDDYAIRSFDNILFSTGNSSTERMRIDSSGNLLVGTTTATGVGNGSSPEGIVISSTQRQLVVGTSSDVSLYLNRQTTDGTIVEIRQNGTTEGSISVSGTTVSYNGGHLARWSQTTDNTRIDGLLKGTVLSNLDEMCDWFRVEFEYQHLVSGAVEAKDAVLDEEGNIIEEAVTAQDAVYETRTASEAYDGTANVGDVIDWTYEGQTVQATVIREDNEQLNRMKVSDVEGDPNVAGVFVNWDDDDDTNTADMNIAMTGDMIIRIAQGTTVQRGDLLMSAGDGTAKPQGDDIVRSKTIAKVTSTHVTCTYDDGSYCVPCVLMAC